MRVLALTKYGAEAASTRQRFVQYEPALAELGVAVTYAPLLDDAYIRRLAEGRRTSPLRIGASYARRLTTLVRPSTFDALWVQCELFPYLPGLFERLASRHRKPIIYDFDDAIFHQYDTHGSALVRRLLGRKLEPLLSAADACCCGNPYLQAYAARFCPNSIVVPTVVNTDIYEPAAAAQGRCPTIGWIGTSSTWPYVRPLLPVIADLHAAYGARLRVIGAGHAGEGDRAPFIDFLPWTEAAEVPDIQKMDIGIMPLTDDPWARGKSGYKLIQYMACGLPTVASPVGVNSNIVRHGVTGFLARDLAQWRDGLVTLVTSAQLRRDMGMAGRTDAVDRYSLESQAPRLVRIMQQARDRLRA